MSARVSARCVAVALGLARLVPTVVCAQQPTPVVPALAFDGVTVVDVEQGKLISDQRVLVVGNRIQTIANKDAVELPKGTQVVDARGKYLIPGLWDMHVHAAGASDVYPLLVAHGITGIREMSSAWPAGFDTIRQRRREIAAGTLVGPRVVATSHDFYSPFCQPEDKAILAGLFPGASRSADSDCIVLNDQTVTTPDEVRRWVDTLKVGGVDFVKAHGITDRQIYFAFLAEARRVGIPTAGHLGWYKHTLTEIEASDSGLRSVEHIVEAGCWQDASRSNGIVEMPLPDSLAEKRCAVVAEHFRRNGTWLVPTLYVYSNPTVRAIYDSAVGLLHRVGVPMLAGTDASTAMANPEQSFASALHEELARLVGAGFTPLEALQTATVNPAKFFGAKDSLGTVAPGKLADLVLLDANPLADITNTTTIRAVVANGRYFDRTALNDVLAEVRVKTGP